MPKRSRKSLRLLDNLSKKSSEDIHMVLSGEDIWSVFNEDAEDKYLMSDHMNMFAEILQSYEFPSQSLFFFYNPELLHAIPEGTRNIQILFNNCGKIGHYVCSYYDGQIVFIYDSLNSGRLHEDHKKYLDKLYPGIPEVRFPTVQNQENGYDCGVFAIAFATSIAFNLQPENEIYVTSELRRHTLQILQNRLLTPFPTRSLQAIREENIPKSSGRPKKNCRGKPKATSSILKRNKEKVNKYTKCNPDVHRISVQKYTKANPEVNRQAVEKYTSSNPDVNRQAVQKYTLSNPDINKRAVKKYRAARDQERNETICWARYSTNQLNSIQSISFIFVSLLDINIFKCEYCHASLFEEEKMRVKWCCGSGMYNIHNLPPLQAPFYTNQQFLKHARKYNNIFAMSALGTSKGFQKPTSGISFVKVLGRIYHRVFDLSYTATRNNTVLYINDPMEHIEDGVRQGLDATIVREIKNYLEARNPIVHQFHSLAEHESSEARLVFQQTNRRTHGPVLGDIPATAEVAGLLRTSSEFRPRQVVIWKIGEQKPHHVNSMNPIYETFQYPLLFPEGNYGWSFDLCDTKGKKLTQARYYRHKLLADDRFTKLRRLSQEYLVDMWCRVEEERLNLLRARQLEHKNRIATRRELEDCETIAGEGGALPGRIYLPSSFTHSPRYMYERYLDAMAIVHRLGKPSFFLTVTCNPRWPEITTSCNPGEYATDRPDLCTRVFNLKLKKLITMIRSGKLFGRMISILYTIEFQKRGLPHAHIAFRVEGGGPTESTDIDEFVRATIPSAEEADGRLRAIVLAHMVHGPCNTNRSRAPCIDPVTNKCTKHFPKKLNPVTYTDDKGFIQYRRPVLDNTVHHPISKQSIDNGWIVPYNPAVLLLMDCHCNLEIATGAKVVKYLYKYIHKGPDRALAELEHENDEIKQYVEFRYVSASEAAWRTFEFDLCCREPTVIILPIHLMDQDFIMFQPGEEAEARERCVSKLMIYFQRPQIPELDDVTYLTFYEQYIVSSTARERSSVPVLECIGGKHFVTKRVLKRPVARIRFVSPTLGEVFFLRMLLMRFPGRSYEDLRTIDNCLYESFQEAAFARGLLNDDKEYFEVMREAAHFKTGTGLRQLYFAIITNGAPAVSLWQEFCDQLCEDHIFRTGNKELGYNFGLNDIDRMLRYHGRTLTDFGLPDIEDPTTEIGRETVRWSNTECLADTQYWEQNLNAEQMQIYRHVIAVVCLEEEHDSNIMFIDGPAGTGKTVLLNAITAKLRSLHKIVLCTASTGIAALNHKGGITAHSTFKLPLDIENDNWGVTNRSQRGQLIRNSHLIIYDEALMANRKTIECLEKGLQDLMANHSIFGGKHVLFAGDFRQIPPIVPGGTILDVVAATLPHSYIWPSVERLHLTINQRIDDSEYSQFILAIGEGRVSSVKIDGQDVIPLPGIPFCVSLEDLIEHVYPAEILSNPNECCRRAILSGINVSIIEINHLILERLVGETVHCYSADSCVTDEADCRQTIDVTILNGISHPGVPEHDLQLKRGAIVLVIRNLSFGDGLVNGTKLIITNISRFMLEARKPEGTETFLIPRISFLFTTGRHGINMSRKQFPIKLAYGMTINKSQGQTLERVGVDLRSDVFAHGQLYVALGRVKRKEMIKILVPEKRVEADVPHTVNVVYPQLFFI